MIPTRLIRTVPQETSQETEEFWRRARDLHPGWNTVTFREPVNSVWFPRTAKLWPSCASGAQKAGLIRLEAVLTYGGWYIDSDVECYRALDPLCAFDGVVAAWEDEHTIADAVFGAPKGHPTIRACLELAITRLRSGSDDWRTGSGAWATGPGVFTEILPTTAALLLPPGAFYPVHYSAKTATRTHTPAPWSFAIHHWNGSWLEV
jgi:mannosyltransferase OCH1-like enzyme